MTVTRRRLAGTVLFVVVLALVAPAGAATPGGPKLVTVSGRSPFPDGCGVDNSFFGEGFQNAETEPTLAVNPKNPRNIVAAWMQDASASYVVGTSFDGGATWRTVTVPGISVCTGGDARAAADPWLSFGPDGTLYLSGFSAWLDAPGPPLPTRFRLQVSTSRDGGRTWSDPVEVIGGAVTFHDKPTIKAHPTVAGTAYVVWQESALVLSPPGPNIFMSRTTDGGATWSPPLPVPAQTVPAGFGSGAEVEVMPDGSLVVMSTLVRVYPMSHTIVAVRSEDGGTTWSAPSIVAEIPASNYPSMPGDCRDPFRPYRDEESGRCVYAPEPLATADTGSDGSVYVVWRHGVPGSPGEIRMSRSTDGARTWSDPVTASPAGGESFTPMIAAGRAGWVAVTYYGFRRDRAGDKVLSGDLWMARSRNGGRTWRHAHVAGPFDWRTSPLRLIPAEGLWLADYHGLVAVRGGYVSTFSVAKPMARTGRVDLLFTRLAG